MRISDWSSDVCSSDLDGSWPGALAQLADEGITTLALTPAADADAIGAVVAERPDRVALMVGAEGPGLSDDAMAAAARRVRIPLAPGVASVNVATAAAIALSAPDRESNRLNSRH